MLQPLAMPVAAQPSFDAPAWRKTALQRRAVGEPGPSLMEWIGAVALTGLVAAAVLAALAAEYAALWAVVVAPWLNSWPSVLPRAW